MKIRNARPEAKRWLTYSRIAACALALAIGSLTVIGCNHSHQSPTPMSSQSVTEINMASVSSPLSIHFDSPTDAAVGTLSFTNKPAPGILFTISGNDPIIINKNLKVVGPGQDGTSEANKLESTDSLTFSLDKSTLTIANNGVPLVSEKVPPRFEMGIALDQTTVMNNLEVSKRVASQPAIVNGDDGTWVGMLFLMLGVGVLIWRSTLVSARMGRPKRTVLTDLSADIISARSDVLDELTNLRSDKTMIDKLDEIVTLQKRVQSTRSWETKSNDEVATLHTAAKLALEDELKPYTDTLNEIVKLQETALKAKLEQYIATYGDPKTILNQEIVAQIENIVRSATDTVGRDLPDPSLSGISESYVTQDVVKRIENITGDVVRAVENMLSTTANSGDLVVAVTPDLDEIKAIIQAAVNKSAEEIKAVLQDSQSVQQRAFEDGLGYITSNFNAVRSELISRLEIVNNYNPGTRDFTPTPTNVTTEPPHGAVSGSSAVSSGVSAPVEPQPLPSRTQSLENDWGAIRRYLSELSNRGAAFTMVPEDIERLASLSNFLNELNSKLDTIRDATPVELEQLDQNLYYPIKFTTLDNTNLEPALRDALIYFSGVINDVQGDFVNRLRESGVERIEGNERKIGEIDIAAQIETNDPNQDNKVFDILPGQGGFRCGPVILKPTKAIIYRYDPPKNGSDAQ